MTQEPGATMADMPTRVHVAIRRPDDDAVLVLADGAMPGFRTRSSPWQVVSPIVARMKADHGLDVAVLRPAWLGDPDRDRLYEAAHLAGRLPAGARWVPLVDLERRATPLGRAIGGGVLDAVVGDGQPWYRADWLPDMVDWIDQQLQAAGIHRRGPVRQFRSWARAAVVQIETDRGRWWAKQVPARFAHEVTVTSLLADIDPGIVPPVLAADPSTGRILVEHVEGPALGSLPFGSGAWVATIQRLAEIQHVMTRERSALRIAGVPDASLRTLAGRIPSLLGADGSSQTPAWSGWTRADRASLEDAIPDLQAACGVLEASGPGPTLDHGDLTADQVIQSAMGPVFLDWSDSTVTHPFLSVISFLDGAPAAPTTAGEELEWAFLQAWTGMTPTADLARDLRVARIVRPLHVAQSYTDLVLPAMDQPWEVSGRVEDARRTLLSRLPGLAAVLA
jgi:hypothetical protein